MSARANQLPESRRRREPRAHRLLGRAPARWGRGWGHSQSRFSTGLSSSSEVWALTPPSLPEQRTGRLAAASPPTLFKASVFQAWRRQALRVQPVSSMSLLLPRGCQGPCPKPRAAFQGRGGPGAPRPPADDQSAWGSCPLRALGRKGIQQARWPHSVRQKEGKSNEVWFN